MDISRETDLLLEGAVPERMQELKQAWGEHQDRVRLQDGQGFKLEQNYGTVQVNETALKSIWLVGFAAWKALEAYSDAIPALLAARKPFDLELLDSIPGQDEYDLEFAETMERVRHLNEALTISEFDWPSNIPAPDFGAKFTDQNQKFAFDLVCFAGAYVVLHEIKHGLIQADPACGELDPVAEEKACDAYAREMLLGKVADYAEAATYPASLVRAKRIIGILFAKLVIVAITPKSIWASSDDHPSVGDRIRELLMEVEDDAPPSLWAVCAGLLAVFARHYGLITEPIEFGSIRELAFSLVELFDESEEAAKGIDRR
ncbi:phage exclusion protein Lit family protein [Bradyrhizobium tunisiense]|uniref:phage exclusion protein Lit family protein n=1 Tax=Bradyrhizobium tunisiense TaxID=3278709 RepID=UPI0035E0683B